jgi:hypothetical protein
LGILRDGVVILDGVGFNEMMEYSVLMTEGKSTEKGTAGFCK